MEPVKKTRMDRALDAVPEKVVAVIVVLIIGAAAILFWMYKLPAVVGFLLGALLVHFHFRLKFGYWWRED